MMELSGYQKAFSISLEQLLQWLRDNNYSVTIGEAYRPPEMAAIYAKEGKGITHSLHTERLAIDLNVFDRDGKFLTEVADLEPIGIYWESLSTNLMPHCWGGRFERVDADHFSIGYEGRK